jgi:hypothetical protein
LWAHLDLEAQPHIVVLDVKGRAPNVSAWSFQGKALYKAILPRHLAPHDVTPLHGLNSVDVRHGVAWCCVVFFCGVISCGVCLYISHLEEQR